MNLGELYFSVLLKDETAKGREKIRKQIEKLKASLNVDIQKSDIKASIRDALANEKFKISVIIDKAEAQQAVRQALQQAGLRQGFTASDSRQVVAEAKAHAITTVAAANAQAILNKSNISTYISLERLRGAAARADNAELSLAERQRRAANSAISHAQASESLSRSLGRQSGLIGQLKSQFADLYSVYAVEGFLRNVIEIGGELENQKLAITAILQDAGKANSIFSQIKSLAIQSPFGLIELNQFAKQLSAYSVPYNELYDTMKRLADISAGVGVDMGRIILAFGQIKAAKFLKGTELRQLTEANIPIVDKLAEHFSKLEGRVVSAGEVLGMISKKKVGFEDVKAVLWELTDEGGMFYNMQEVLSESVKSKWKNLSDAIDIMYSDIAEGNSGILKGVAEALTALAQNYDKLMPIVYGVLGTLGTMKIVSLATVASLGKENVAIKQNIVAQRQRESQNLRIASSYRQLTATEQAQVAMSKKKLRQLNTLTIAELEQLATNKQLTAETALQSIAFGKLDASQARHLVRLKLITQEQAMYALRQASSVKILRLFSLNLGTFNAKIKIATLALKRLGLALKTLVFNPATLLMLGISAVVEGWSYITSSAEEAEERTKDFFTSMSEGYKSLSEVANKYQLDAGILNIAEYTTAINEMVQALKDNAPEVAGNILSDIFGEDADGKVKSLAEKYQLLADAIIAVANAKKMAAQNSDLPQIALDASNGVFDEGLHTNMTDYYNALKNEDNAILKLAEDWANLEEHIENAKKQHKDYAKVAEGKNRAEQIRLLLDYKGALEDVLTAYGKADWLLVTKAKQLFNENIVSIRYNVNAESNIVYNDLEQSMTKLKSALTARGYDLNNLVLEQEISIRALVKEIVNAKDVPDDIKKKFEVLGLQTFGIDANVEFDGSQMDNELVGMKKKFDDATNGVFTAKIKTTTDGAQGIIDAIKKEYKAAKEHVKTLKPIMLKLGIKAESNFEIVSGLNATSGKDEKYILSNGAKIWLSSLTEAQQEVLREIDSFNKIIRGAEAGATEMGFSLMDNDNRSDKDPLAERLKERYNLLKDANSMFEKLRKTYGDTEAMSMIKESGIFNAFFPENGEPTNIQDISNELDNILKQLDNKTQKRRDLKIDIEKLKLDIKEKAKRDAVSEAMKSIERTIDESAKKWNLFNKIFENTGNKDLAYGVAFNSPFKTGADDFVKSIKDTFDGAMKKEFLYTYEGLSAMSTDELKNVNSEVKKVFENTQKKIQNYKDSQLEDLAEILAKYKTNAEEIKLIEANRLKTLNAINQAIKDNRISTDKGNRLTAQVNANADYDKLTRLADYLKFFSAIYSLTLTEAQNIGDAIKKNLNDKLKAGTISVEEYADEIAKIKEQIDKIINAKGDFHALLAGGLDAMFKNQSEKADSDYKETLIRYQNATTDAEKKSAKVDADAAADRKKAADDTLKSFLAARSTMGGIADVASGIHDAFKSVMEMAEAFGADTGAGTIWGDIDLGLGILSDMTSSAQAAMQGNVGGIISGVFGALTAPFTAFAKYHDAKLQRQIEESQKKVQQLQATYSLIEQKMEKSLGGQSGYSSSYQQQRKNLQRQRAELQRQRDAELDKKDTDDAYVADLNNQIAEMSQQIKDFAEEAAETLYSINIKDWASQLGDALYSAWQKGEDGAEAFRKKVTEIMGDVMNQILKVKILEPAMKKLQTMLFGDDGMSGMFGSDFSLDENELAQIADYLMGIIGKSDDYYDALDKLNDYMERRYGVTMKEEEEAEGESLKKGIQGVTENTANLLASYINAIRADVSMKREYARRLIEDLFPTYNLIAQAQLQQLQMIQANTAKNAELVLQIKDMLHQNINPGKGFKIA